MVDLRSLHILGVNADPSRVGRGQRWISSNEPLGYLSHFLGPTGMESMSMAYAVSHRDKADPLQACKKGHGRQHRIICEQ